MGGEMIKEGHRIGFEEEKIEEMVEMVEAGIGLELKRRHEFIGIVGVEARMYLEEIILEEGIGELRIGSFIGGIMEVFGLKG